MGARPLTKKDAAKWSEIRASDAAWLGPWEATLPKDSGPGIASFRDMVRTLRKRARQGQVMPFAVTYDNEMVGQLTVSGITWGSARWASIGYWVAHSHAGRSITPTAVALVMDHLFGTAGLHRIEIAIRPENVASLRVVEKLGFRRIGMAPRYLHIAGEWRDHFLFQQLAEDIPGGMLGRLESSVD